MTILHIVPRSPPPGPPAQADGEAVPSPWDLPIYRMAEAARLTQYCGLTVKRWSMGGTYRYRGEIRHTPGMIGCAPRKIGGRPLVTFRQLLSMRVVKGMRAARLSLRTVRRIAVMAAAASGDPIPLAAQRFRADGADAFLALDQARRASTGPEMPGFDHDAHDAESWEFVFTDMLDRALFRDVDWLDGMPARWWPMGHGRSVALDPRVVGGLPHIAGTRVLTTAIAADMRTCCDGEAAIPTVAAAHGLTAQQVRDAVHFETVWLLPQPYGQRVRSDSSLNLEALLPPPPRPKPSPKKRRPMRWRRRSARSA
jgi:uncharacterized protein (DUF433 family)